MSHRVYYSGVEDKRSCIDWFEDGNGNWYVQRRGWLRWKPAVFRHWNWPPLEELNEYRMYRHEMTYEVHARFASREAAIEALKQCLDRIQRYERSVDVKTTVAVDIVDAQS